MLGDGGDELEVDLDAFEEGDGGERTVVTIVLEDGGD